MELELPLQRLTRLTVNLLRPIPWQPLRVESAVIRQGRTVSISRAEFVDTSGKTIVSAEGMHMTTSPDKRQVHSNAFARLLIVATRLVEMPTLNRSPL